jgi:hypothetical protein
MERAEGRAGQPLMSSAHVSSILTSHRVDRRDASGGPGVVLGEMGRYPAVGSSAVTEDNLALDVRGSPGKTAARMALSPGLLIRMRSQVQVLAGPPHHS